MLLPRKKNEKNMQRQRDPQIGTLLSSLTLEVWLHYFPRVLIIKSFFLAQASSSCFLVFICRNLLPNVIDFRFVKFEVQVGFLDGII